MRSILMSAAVLLAITSATLARADTEKLDNIAACAGIVIGNGSVDFLLGDEASYDAAAEFAYLAYLSELLGGKDHSQDEYEMADQILRSNINDIINAYNNDSFDNEVYEEVVGCYRQLGTQILEKIDVIMLNGDEYQEMINSQIQTIKRMLRAG